MNEKHADLLIQWVREAGKRSLDLRNKGLDVQTKADESVVTNADFELNDFFEEKAEYHNQSLLMLWEIRLTCKFNFETFQFEKL